MISNPAIRKWLYVVGPLVSTTLLILVTAGVIDAGMSASIANAVASLLYIATGGVAAANLSPKPAVIGKDVVAVITDALDAYATRVQPAIETAQTQAQKAADDVREFIDPFIRR